MIAAEEIELFPQSLAGAAQLIAKARTHHLTASDLAHRDPEIAIDALHAGNRKALEAVLLARGLRPTKSGGHVASLEAVRSMISGTGLGVLRVYNVVRRARHEGDYANAESNVNPDDIDDNLDDSKKLVNACEATIAIVPPFVPGRR